MGCSNSSTKSAIQPELKDGQVASVTTVQSGGGKGKKSAAEALATDPSEYGGQDKVNGKTTELGVNQF